MEVSLSKREAKRNFVLSVFNGALFNFAKRLIDPPLVLTWFVSHLTDSNLLVGLVVPLGQAGWFLPQIFVSTRIQRMERKMPGYTMGAVVRIVAWFLLAAAVWLSNDRLFLLISFFALYSLAWVGAGLAGLSFFDVIAKTIPARRRGSLFAWRQFLGSLLGLGAGWIVSTVLNHPSLPFPRGHAFLFLLYGVTIIPAMAAFIAIREPPGSALTEPMTLGEQLRRARQIFWKDDVYRRYMTGRVVLGLAGIALPFYSVYAKKVLDASAGMVGVYVAARVGAQLLLNLPWGRLSDRRGNRLIMQLLSVGTGLTALLALILVGLVSNLQLEGAWLSYLALPIFLLNGAILPAKVLSGSNFLLELVPEDERPLYMGLSNTLMGVVVLVSGLGGLVVDLSGFTGLFVLTVMLCVIGYMLVKELPEPRESA